MARIIFVGESELQISDEDYYFLKNKFIFITHKFYNGDIPKYIRLKDGTLVNTDNILCIEE